MGVQQQAALELECSLFYHNLLKHYGHRVVVVHDLSKKTKLLLNALRRMYFLMQFVFVVVFLTIKDIFLLCSELPSKQKTSFFAKNLLCFEVVERL